MLHSHPSPAEFERQPSARAAVELDEALGNAIRTRRSAVGMTQHELAGRCGISFQQIQKYESGANRISFSRLAQIANALGTSVADFANALMPSEGTAPTLKELQLLAIPGALDLLTEFAQLTPEGQRVLLAFLRQVRDDRG